MLVKYKPTGQLGNIPDDKFDPNLFERADTPNNQTNNALAASPSGGGIGDALGSILINAAKGMAQPFVNTAKRIGGAGYEMSRASANNTADILNKLGLGNLAQKYSEVAARDNPILNTQNDMNTATNPVQIAKDSAGILSWGVPVGEATSIGGRAIAASPLVGGAIAGGLQGFSGSGDTAESMVGNTALGGITGGAAASILSRILGAGKGLQNAGKDIRGGILNTDVGNTPWAYGEKNAALDLQNKIGLKGSSANQQKQLNTLWNEAQGNVAKALEGKPGLPKTTAKEMFNTALKDTNYLADRKSYQGIVNEQQKRLLNSVDSASKMNKLKVDLRSELATAFKKLENGNSNLSQVEEVKMALFNTTKNMLETVAPDVGPINSYESQLFNMAKGIGQKVKEPGGISIPLVGKVGKGATESIQDAVGRGMLNTGTGLDKILSAVPGEDAQSIGANTIASILSRSQQSQPVSQAPTPDNAPAPSNTPATAPTPNTGGDITSMLTPEKMMLARMVLNPKEYTKLKDMYDIKVASEKTGQESEAEKTRTNTRQLIKSAFDKLKQGGVVTGMIGGPLESLKGKFNKADQKTLDFNVTVSNLAATIAKARGGTSFTPNEQALLDKYTPKVGDSQQELETKLRILNDYFETAK